VERGIPAVAFAVSGCIGASNRWDQAAGAAIPPRLASLKGPKSPWDPPRGRREGRGAAAPMDMMVQLAGAVGGGRRGGLRAHNQNTMLRMLISHLKDGLLLAGM
jgi:hypothetical protein